MPANGKPKISYVGFTVHDYGYDVNVYGEDDQPIEQYTAGNHARDSQGYVERGDPDRLDRKTLRRFARQTATEMAASYGADSFCVHEEE